MEEKPELIELVETRNLLHETISLLKMEAERHVHDMADLRNWLRILFKHHEEEIADIHRMLRESEERIAATNAMVQKLSDVCSEMMRINSELKDSYVLQFERATSMNNHLIDEATKIREENLAYYDSVKKLRAQVDEERARYDRMMEQMVSMVCGGGRATAPLVAIDSKS